MNTICVYFYIVIDENTLLDAIILSTENTEVKILDSLALKQLPSQEKISKMVRLDGYFLSVFRHVVKHSERYREMVAINIVKCCKPLKRSSDINIKCLLVRPKIEVLDYAWSKRIIQLVSQRQELENAMSWLSTLGGAFSALGDNFESCAKVAAKISIQQFKIAFQLGEPLLLARCRLYMALSLIQLGKLSSAKKVIQNQYLLSKSFNDIRLEKMCKGIWTKLQYVYKQKYNRLKQCHNNKLQII